MTQKQNYKELFQAAQHDDFTAVRDYLQVILHEQAEESSENCTNTTVKTLVEPKTKNTLLHYACDNGNLDACKYLLMCDGMFESFLNEPNTFGHTPLFYACSSGRLPLVKWLISNGADIDTDYSDRIDITPRDGDHGIFTPLQIACFKGNDEIVNFLVECNAELSGTRRNAKTPLHVACSANHRSIVKVLLEAGADVHACDDQGKTPIDVAHASLLPLLLDEEHGEREMGEDSDLEAPTDGDDNDGEEDMSFAASGEQRLLVETIKSAFGSQIARDFTHKAWKIRVNAITEASLCFQNVSSSNTKANIKLFDGACRMLCAGLQDPVAQVVSSCCTQLLKAAFTAAMNEKEFHTSQFHCDRPILREITAQLLNRGAASNDKDASEAVACLLFLICKSMDLTQSITTQISQIMATTSSTTLASLPAKSNSDSSTNSIASTTTSWRLQLVAIKIFNTIASQYRLDPTTSGLNFADAIKVSMAALENSSVHVRTAAIDLLVQCLLIRCEQSDMTGTTDEIYEQMKNWCESLFKQQNQPLKPSIQAKINNGLKNALQKSKRLQNIAASEGKFSPTERRPFVAGDEGSGGKFDVPTPSLSPRSKSTQREDDLPYAEPIQEQYQAETKDLLTCFGEKVTRCLFSNAWAPRVEALSFLQHQIESRQLSFDGNKSQRILLVSSLQKTLLQALQDRVNSVFEAGVALLMEVTIAFNNSSSTQEDKTSVMQDLLRPLIPRLLVKLGDSKSRIHVTVEDALLLLSRQCGSIGPAFLLEEMIAYDRNASPQTLSATYLGNKMALISKLLLEFGVQEGGEPSGILPIKNVLQPALQVCEHKDHGVRQVALQIVADTLQVARTATMPFLDALARSSRQKIISKLVEKGVLASDLLMDEVDDFEIVNEPMTSRPGTSGGIRPPTASGSSTKHRPALSNTSLSSAPAAHSSASLTQPVTLPYGTALTSEQKEMFSPVIQGFGEELVRCLLDKAWAQREAAIREIERQVICSANGKLPSEQALPKTLTTLGYLSHVLEIGMNDTVARVFQCSLRLFQVTAQDFLPLLPDSESSHLDEILSNVVGLVLQKLGDTKQRIRQDCFTLLHSMASLNHIGHARLCKMLADKYQQLVSSSATVASSPLMIGELLRLFTLLIKEAPTSAQRIDLAAILTLLTPTFENKHVDVRNAAIDTYAAIYEVTNGGQDDHYRGSLDLHGFLAQTKPTIREAITRSVVQISKTALVAAGSGEDADRPEVDSGRQQPLALDVAKLTQICGGPQIPTLLTSASSAQQCLGIDKLMGLFLDAPRNPAFKGGWELSCLLVKQLALEGIPSVCLLAMELLELLVNPPLTGAVAAEYAIPWGEWGVHLVLGSTIRSIVQLSANESVRVRSRVKTLLQVVAAKNSAGKNAVSNALLSAPEDQQNVAEVSKRGLKITRCKLRWQFMLRLELLYDLMTGSGRTEENNNVAVTSTSARRKISSNVSTSKSSSDALGIENVVPFLGSSVTHPSPSVRAASRKIMNFLRSTREQDVLKFIQEGCSSQLQRRLQTLLGSQEETEMNNADHFNVDDATCVRGSRASHVRRIAALRPPRSVPVEETKMMVDVFPPPHSAPGKSRRPSIRENENDDNDSMNDGSSGYVVMHHNERDDQSRQHTSKRQQQPQSETPIWLDQGTSLRKKSGTSSYGDNGGYGEPESVVGAAGLMKIRRKSSFRTESDNNDEREAAYSRNGIH